jgi:Ca2+-binding RTX toxin-like protein
MLGLFGVMMAGLAADAVFSFRDDDNDEAEPPAPDDGEPSLDDGDLLDDLSGDPTIPTSDDLDDPVDPSVTLTGTDGVDQLSGNDAGDDLQGGGGDDMINGRGGDDLIDAGGGNDAIWAGDGDDSILAEGGG